MVAEHGKQREEQLFDAMYPAIEATGSEHGTHIALFKEKRAGQRVIATKEQGGN